jgi:tRNA pseudouridine55 synthase
MAEGLLIVLVDDENLKRKEYEQFKKTYESEILFGIETDSYDALGLVTNQASKGTDIDKSSLEKALHSFLGAQTQPYPPYSSPRINGKPLFYWARENKLDQIKIPEKQIEIYTITLQSFTQISAKQLQAHILDKIHTIKGEFRQTAIEDRWNEFFEKCPDYFQLAKVEVTCSSGTYIRSLAHLIGKKLETYGIALSIKRTHIGTYTIGDTKNILV